MTFYIIKHPETEFNKNNIISGWKDSPLTAAGVKATEAAGKKLQNRNITKIYSSNLERCLAASKIVNKYLGVKITAVPELREINYGIYNGKREKEVKKIFAYKNDNSRPPKGESMSQVKKRVLSFLNSLTLKKEREHFLIVTHDGCLTALLSHYYQTKFTSKKCQTPQNFIGIIKINKNTITSIKKLA